MDTPTLRDPFFFSYTVFDEAFMAYPDVVVTVRL